MTSTRRIIFLAAALAVAGVGPLAAAHVACHHHGEVGDTTHTCIVCRHLADGTTVPVMPTVPLAPALVSALDVPADPAALEFLLVAPRGRSPPASCTVS